MIDNDIIKQGLIFRFLQMSFARSLLVYRKIAYIRLQYFLHLPHRHIFDLATPRFTSSFALLHNCNDIMVVKMTR